MRSVAALLRANLFEFGPVNVPSQIINLFFVCAAILWLVVPIQTNDHHAHHSIHPVQISLILSNIQRCVRCCHYIRQFVVLSPATILRPANGNFVLLLYRAGPGMPLRTIPNFPMLSVDRISCILLCSRLMYIRGFADRTEQHFHWFYRRNPKLFPVRRETI